MSLYVLLALINGLVIGLSRALNGRLSHSVGPFRASLCNHLVGFLFANSKQKNVLQGEVIKS